ncbi:methyltransferase [Bradyrhizobium murdochi]|uniref:methyltransferase n=1 Tax=Bradyrhizobium murdochi TaxID=1038859 RepID=UPI00041CCD57|nr:methyltransferase [Bradyrhizobium murdochi]
MSSSAPALKLLDLIQSHRVTAVIYVAARLGIADLLSDKPKSLDELAKETGADRAALARLLAALVTTGICTRAEGERYALGETGTALIGDAHPSFKAWAILEGELLSKTWSGMLETIMTGKTAAQLQGFDNSFDLMARAPETVRVFNAAMAELTAFVTADVLAAYDFSRISHLLDVGGGSGELIGAVIKRYGHIRGTVFDLPRCEEAATAHLAKLGVSDRAGFIAGDFFRSVPASIDSIILKSIIHDWNDELSCTILQNCRRAMPEAGTLLLVERLMPAMPGPDNEHKSHALSDLNMLRGPGGMERTEAQYRDLLGSAGFRMSSIAPAGRFNVIEARPV